MIAEPANIEAPEAVNCEQNNDHPQAQSVPEAAGGEPALIDSDNPSSDEVTSDAQGPWTIKT